MPSALAASLLGQAHLVARPLVRAARRLHRADGHVHAGHEMRPGERPVVRVVDRLWRSPGRSTTTSRRSCTPRPRARRPRPRPRTCRRRRRSRLASPRARRPRPRLSGSTSPTTSIERRSSGSLSASSPAASMMRPDQSPGIQVVQVHAAGVGWLGDEFAGQPGDDGIFGVDEFVGRRVDVGLVIADPEDFAQRVRGAQPVAGDAVHLVRGDALAQPAAPARRRAGPPR